MPHAGRLVGLLDLFPGVYSRTSGVLASCEAYKTNERYKTRRLVCALQHRPLPGGDEGEVRELGCAAWERL